MAVSDRVRSTDPAQAGITVDADELLRLRHLVRAGQAMPKSLTALPGGFVVRRRGRGLEVDDIRVFAEGDDMRHLDRNTTARTGVPHVRTFRDERERTVILMVDLRPSMLWGSRRCLRSVAACEAAALVGWRAIDVGGRVGLLGFGAGDPVVVPARGRDRGMISVIGGMAGAHAQALAGGGGVAEPTLEAGLELVARIAPKGAAIVLVTGLDHPGTGFEAAIGALQRKADVSALIIADAFELRPPPGDYAYAGDDGSVGIGRIARDANPAARPGPGPAPRDVRLERLDRLGIDAALIDAAAGPAAAMATLEAFDGGR